MKFLDANIFLRYLVQPATDADRVKQRSCTTLFSDVASGKATVTTSESVVHEVLYVLCSPRQYGLTHEDAVARLLPVLSLRSFHLARRRIFADALGLFARYGFLDFADAVTATVVRAQAHDLLSYDSDFDRVPGIRRQEP